MSAARLAARVEPRLDPFTFGFDWLRNKLEELEPGAGRQGWQVLDRLEPCWEELGWRTLRSQVEAGR